MTNPLALLAQRFPNAFGLEWVETEDIFPTGDPRIYDVRKIRHLSGGFIFLDDNADGTA